jgi:DNA invertase Pin-like site-specific DNA recombinase
MTEKKALLKAIGLIRLSTAEQAAEGRAGIDRQRADIQVAARLHGLEVTRVVEVIESGTKVRGQRDFQQIFRDLEAGAVDGVACSNLDRLVRPDCFEDFGVFDHFRRNRKKIFTPGEVVDPATQNGFLVSGVRGLLAGIERQLIVARTTAGKEELRKQGRHPGGDQVLPRGVCYHKATRQWSYDGVDSECVRRAYQLLFLGQSFCAIADAIGNGWTGNGIRCAMRNSIWYGVRTFPPTADRAEPLERRVIPEAEALVSHETWQKAQAIMDKRKQAWGARKRTPRFLLASLLRCSCGKPYYMRANARRDRTRQQEHYYCSAKCGARSLQRVAADQRVVEEVKTRFRDPQFLLGLLELSARQTEARTDAAKLERELVKLEAKRTRVVDAYADGIISKEDCARRTAALDQQARELRALLPAKAPALDARRTVKGVAEFFAGFEDQSFEDQRRTLRTAFKEFIVHNSTITGWTLNLGSVVGAKVARGSRSRYSRRFPGRETQSPPQRTLGFSPAGECRAGCRGGNR